MLNSFLLYYFALVSFEKLYSICLLNAWYRYKKVVAYDMRVEILFDFSRQMNN